MKIHRLLAALLALTASAFSAEPRKTSPDLTQDSAVDRKLTDNLGATGLRGWTCSRPATHFDGLPEAFPTNNFGAGASFRAGGRRQKSVRPRARGFRTLSPA